jgi:hypothetical protein
VSGDPLVDLGTVQQAEMSTVRDDHAAPRALLGRPDQEIVGGEDRQLPARKAMAVVWGSERDEPPDLPSAPGLDEVSRDETTETVPDDVEHRFAGPIADVVDEDTELGREPPVGDPRPVAEGREAPDAAELQGSSEVPKVDSAPEQTVNEYDRRTVAILAVEGVSAEIPSERGRQSCRSESFELSPEVTETVHRRVEAEARLGPAMTLFRPENRGQGTALR